MKEEHYTLNKIILRTEVNDKDYFYVRSKITIIGGCPFGHSIGLGSKNNSISRTGSSSGTVENKDEFEGLMLNASKTSSSVVQRQPIYEDQEPKNI